MLAAEETGGSRVCLNCAAPISGPFCGQCGQRDIPPYPTVRELAGDTAEELIGWDGKFVTTMKALLLKPGFLTREFLAGRRARYLKPVRLYLTCSVAYFLLAAAAPEVVEVGQAGVGVTFGGLHVGVTEGEQPPALLAPLIDAVSSHPVEFRQRLYARAPQVMFVMVPFFAVVVSMLFRRRRYPEHLYFALHFFAFAFLMLCLQPLAAFARVSLVTTAVVGIGSAAAIAGYGFLALRQVYGASRLATTLRGFAIALVYLTGYGAAMLGVGLTIASQLV